MEPEQAEDFDSPALMALRDVWDAYVEGEADSDDVVGVVHQIAASLEQHLDVLQEQVNQGTSDVYDPIFSSVCKAFMSHLQALKHMLKEFQGEADDGRCFFEEGYEMAQKATNQMMEAHHKTMARIESKAPSFGGLPVATGRLEQRSLWEQDFVLNSGTGEVQLESFLRLKKFLESYSRGEISASRVGEIVSQTKEAIMDQARQNISIMSRLGIGSPREQRLRKAFSDSGLTITRVIACLDRVQITLKSLNAQALTQCLGELEQVCRQLACSYREVWEVTRS